MHFTQYASKLIENERHQHDKANSNANRKTSSSSPECLETSDQIKKEQVYHSSIFSMSQNRYPYARELMESYHHKMSLNLGNAKKEEEEEEELNVDRDADVNIIGLYQKRESQNETSNVPEDLSKKGSNSNASIEESNRYHPYKHEKSIRAQSPNIIAPEDQNTRQSPTHNGSMV